MPRARSTAALADYRHKRDFSATPEPRGGDDDVGDAAPAFTVQRHAARRLHYDFRLELDGVLHSWAVPRGPSLDPNEKRLAVEVEDHPLEYGEFEGAIPEGHYGAGQVLLWDRGTWRCEDDDPARALAQGHLKFSLHGFKLHGRWALVRLAEKEREEEAPAANLRHARHHWLLIKERDGAARRGTGAEITERLPGSVRQRLAAMAATSPLPVFIAPQLATLVSAPPEQEGWVYEVKYDGYRLLARLADGAARLFTRAGNDWTSKLPALARQLAALGMDGSWLDGEIAVLDPDGVPDFQALQNAFERKSQSGITYFVFDAPWLAGRDLRALPVIERKQRLAASLARRARDGEATIAYSEHFQGEPGQISAALEQACRLGLEGLVGKQGDAPYVSERSRNWIKLKCRPRQEFVIGGYTDPRGSRSGFGALLLGLFEQDGSLRYVGRVGSGFDEALLAKLAQRLDRLRTEHSPFVNPPHEKEVHWVRPDLVAEAAFSGWTRENVLRQASFLGLREDKPAAGIGREDPQPAAAIESDTTAIGSADSRVGGVRLTHPDRIVWPESGITKSDLAHYYEGIAQWLLPQLDKRPLSLLRCPDGSASECFFQKHLGRQRPLGVRDFAWEESSGGKRDYVYVETIDAVIGLVQRGIVEFHTWGSSLPDPARPDRLTIDLDPAPDVPWPRVVEGAQLARAVLEQLGFVCFVKTTGGKGLHVVAPLERRHGWDEVKAFTRAIAQHLARVLPDRFTANMAKSRRAGRIFVDYLRNDEGATAIAAYSTRARSGAPVSVPLYWDELSPQLNPVDWTLKTVPARLAAMRGDPWQDYDGEARRITAKMRRALGIDAD